MAALSARRGPKPGKAGANAADAEIAWLRAELDTAREVIRAGGTVRALGEALSRQRGDVRE